MKRIIIILSIGVLIFAGVYFLRKNNQNSMEEKIIGDVVLKTSMGDVVIDLFEDEAPITSGNFLKLAKEGFYNGTRFHRVIEDFMIQGGDPLSKDPNQKSLWGTGGPGYQFEDEVVPGLSNVSGTISMANAGPGTNGSQFFLNVADNSFLDGRHTVFGKVVNGMDVVMAMSGVETEGKGTMDRPREDLILEEINVIEE